MRRSSVARTSRTDTCPHQELEPARKLLVFLFLIAAACYFAWRLGSFNREALWFSRLVFAAELYGFATTLMHLFMTWRLTVREAPVPTDGLGVDVFIATINEPVALLRKTLLATLRMEYPHRTWLLDDGNRPEMKELCRELGCGYLNRRDNVDAKTGNLNHALRRTEGEFIAVFDADHAPKKNFLLRTLGYFTDPTVAFVQTPQDFYNLDSFQHHRKREHAVAWHEQSVFFRVIQRGKDYWASAFFCGSCAVIRRSALDAVGGFATGTVTEDLHTSVRFHKKGFSSVYHAEPLAFGLAPSGVVPFLKQRIRWGQGAMQVWRKEGVFFCRGLTLAQRINYVASSITYFDGWQKGLFYLIPGIVLISGVMPIAGSGREFLLHFIPYFLLSFWVFEEVNRGYGRSLVIEQYNMARFAALAWSTLALFKSAIPFRVTPKEAAPRNDLRLSVAPQAAVLAGNVAAIVCGLVLYLSRHHLPMHAVVANVVWASANTLLAIGVMLFTARHSRHRRNDYRFGIPLPARIVFPCGTESFGTVDDISSAGFRLYAPLPSGLDSGTAVTGELYLPSGRLPFHATVRSLIEGTDGKERYVKAVGCCFEWSDNRERDRLEAFLYGSDTQLALNELTEVIETPLDWLGKRARRQPRAGRNGARWNAAVCTGSVGSATCVGLVSAPGAGGFRKLVSFSPMEDGSRVQVTIYGRRSVAPVAGTVRFRRTIETPHSPFYLFQLECAAASDPTETKRAERSHSESAAPLFQEPEPFCPPAAN